MLDGTPTLFDGIEFNAEFSCIDVMYDFAFLVMDLLGRALGTHANALFNRYLSVTGDFEGLRLLPLFLACRAAIRAKTSLAAADLSSDPSAIAGLRCRATAYLNLAEQVSRSMPPRLIALGGFSGSGKSTLAARIAPTLGTAPGAVVLRTDVVRKLMFADGARRAYLPSSRHSVYTEIRREAANALDAGYVVVVDAVFGEAAERHAIEKLAADEGVAFDGLWLDAHVRVLEERIERRRSDESEATVDVLYRQMFNHAPAISWRRIDAGRSEEATELEALRTLNHEAAA
jgi:predicted kinase